MKNNPEAYKIGFYAVAFPEDILAKTPEKL